MKKAKALAAAAFLLVVFFLPSTSFADTVIYLDSSILNMPLSLKVQDYPTSLPILRLDTNYPKPQPLIPVTITFEASKSATPSSVPNKKVRLVVASTVASRPGSSSSTLIKKLESIPGSIAGSLSADKLFAMVNGYRAKLNLPAFQQDSRVCTLAQSRAPQVGTEIESGNMHAGLKSLNLPYWNTENIISMRTVEGAFNWWINDYIHRKAIEGDYRYSCVACSGNSCAEEFTNFAPK